MYCENKDCGLPDNRFITFEGRMLCMQCYNSLLLNIEEKSRVQNRGDSGRKGVKPIPETDTFGVQIQPVGFTVGEAYKKHGVQLKLF